MNFYEKNKRVLLFVVYAVIMFTAIQSQINSIGFFLLFILTAFVIYFFVKTIFPKKD